MKADLFFSVILCGMREPVFVPNAAQGQLGGAQMHVLTHYCVLWKYLSRTKSGNCMQTCTYVQYSPPQESKEKERFSIDFWASQSQRRWPQLCHHPSQSEGMMSSHFFHIWVLICCSESTHTHTHSHTHTRTQTEAIKQPALLEADDRIFFAIL